MREHDMYGTSHIKVGQVVKGKVLKVQPTTIYLDLQAFTEGKIHLNAYTNDKNIDTFVGLVKIGDIVEARIQKVSLDEPSLILLSRLPLLQEQLFDNVIKAKDEGTEVEVKVKKYVEKGLLADYLGYEIFIPFGLVEHQFKEDPKAVLGKTLNVIILEAERRGRSTNVVASRKPIFQKERQEALELKSQQRNDELDAIKKGDVLEGKVEKIDKNAAIIRFEHVMGLLRISQISHLRVENIFDVLHVGDTISVKVINKEGSRLDLSMKALQKTPYEVFQDEHKISEKLIGKVVQKLPFGIILQLSQGVKGLLHRSEFSWNPNDNLDSYVKIGDDIEVCLMSIDAKKEKISLSKKALEDNPWRNVNLKRGDITKTVITSIDKTNLTVEVQGVPGLIPFSELSSEKLGKIEDYFSVGDTVEAEVTDFNKNEWILKLSIKKIQTKAERADFEKYLEAENDDKTVKIGDIIDKDSIK